MSACSYRQVIITAASAGFEMKVSKAELDLTSCTDFNVPVAFSIGVVGQGVVRGRETTNTGSQSSSTT